MNLKRMFIILLIAYSINGLAQEKYLINNWIVNYTMLKNKKIYPKNDDDKLTIKFNPNNSFEEIEDGNVVQGNWEYHSAKQQIILTSSEFPTKLIFKIIKLSEEVFEFSARNDDDSKVIIHMSKIKK